MKNNLVRINSHDLQIKEYQGRRVVTFKDIDIVHERPEGTAKRNFNENKEHFIEGEDFYFVKPADVQGYEIRTSEINNSGTYLITESGYLMLVKSFTDDLAWRVQRELVNNYFRTKQPNLSEDKQKLADARLRNAKAREANILLKIANNPDLNKEYRQVLFSYASGIIAGKPLLPLPELAERTLSAEEVGKELGITANMVGRVAKANNLKTEQYGKWFHDKSRYSNKEVPSFKYYENVIPVIKTLLNQDQKGVI